MSGSTKPAFMPTPEQEQALAKYKEWAERLELDWRRRLQADWMRAGTKCEDVEWAYLQQLRNADGGMEWVLDTPDSIKESRCDQT